MPVDRLLSLSEAAKLAEMSTSKAYRLAKAKKEPFQDVRKHGSTYAIPYLAFCERLGLRLDDAS